MVLPLLLDVEVNCYDIDVILCLTDCILLRKKIVICLHNHLLWLMQEYDVEDSLLPLQPSLNYTAPELVRSKVPSVGSSSDIFSFGCVAYHLIAQKPLFDCHNNVKMVFLLLSILVSSYNWL